MASYAQIAQKSWTVPREDGSSRTYQLTIEQRNGSTQSLEIPLIQDIVVTMGDASDELNKAIKTHQLQFQLKAESAAGDLISVISDCGHRELRIVLEETTNGYIHFQGYIIADRTEFGLYEKVQSVAVKATGMLNDLATTPAADSTRSFGSFAEDINAALDLDRLLDVYSNLRPSGRSASDILPDYIHFNPHQASGQEDESNITNALQSMLLSTGMQLFQENGRIVLSDIFDRYNNPTLKRYKQTGAGFDVTTRSTRIGLDADNVIRGGRFKALPPIRAYNHNFILNTRANSVFLAQTNADPGTASQSAGMVRAGDVIRLTHYGVANITLDDLNSSTGIITFGALRLEDEASGVTYWYDFDSEEWTTDQFTRETGFDVFSSLSFPVPFGSQTPINLEPVPDGVVGRIHLEMLNGVTTSNGTFALNAPKHNAQINFDSVEPASNLLRHSYTVFSAEAVADEISANFYIADGDKYTASQAFRDGASLIEEWTDGTNTGTLLEIVAERIGQLLIGNRRRFVVQLRDAATISLLNSFSIIDDAAVTHIALPVCIKHNVLRGYYEITCIGLFDVIEQSQEYYAFDVETTPGSGMTGTPSRPPGGGVTDHGLLTGLNHPEHHPWALKTDFSNIQSTGALLAELDAEYLRIGNDLSDLNSVSTARANLGVAIGTDVQAWSVNLDKLATLDGEDLVNLNASKLAAGTVPNARLSGSYTGITGTGALTAGSIGVGFGDIDIGSKKLTAASLNTGQGNNQLYKMNQDLETTSNVKFNRMDLEGPLAEIIRILRTNSTTDFSIRFDGQDAGGFNLGGINVSNNTYLAVADHANLTNNWVFRINVHNGDTELRDLSARNGKFSVLNRAGAVVFTDNDGMLKNIEDVTISNSGDLSAATLRTSSGKFLSPVNYQFRNAGDTNFRDVEMAGLTATTGLFSGNVGTSDYSAGLVGYRITPAGKADFRDVFANTMHVEAFTADVAQAFRGSRWLTKSFAVINESFIIPAIGSTATIKVDSIKGYAGLQVFAKDDYLMLNVVDMSGGGLLVGEVWGIITTIPTGSDVQQFTFKTLWVSSPGLVGMRANKGSEIISVGSSTLPLGIMQDTVLDSAGAPYSRIFTWSGTTPWDRATWSLKTHWGNLDGIDNASGWGQWGARSYLTDYLLAGDLTKNDANSWFEYDVTTGEMIFSGSKMKIASSVQIGALENFGGRNLIPNSGDHFSTSSYMVKEWIITEDWIERATYTIRLKGSISGTQRFRVYQNRGTNARVYLTDLGDGTFIGTFTSTTITAGNERVLRIYNYPNNSPTESATIEWIKLESGTVATAYSPAPEDIELASKDETAKKLGYANWADWVTKGGLSGKTLISGGYINTDAINVDSIIANKSIIVAGDNISDLTNDSGFQTAGNVSSAISAFAGGLGDLALEDLVSLSKLDGTIISGGYIKTSLINTAAIAVGDLSDGTDYALIQDIITSYDDLSGKPSLGDVAKLNSITSTYIANGAVVTAKIAAGSITTAKLATDAIKSLNYNYISGDYSDAGSFFDLAVGTIRTPEFSVVSGKARFAGELISPVGRLGGLNLELEELWGGAADREDASLVVSSPAAANPYIGMYGEDGVRTELLAGANPLIALTGVGGIEQVFIGGAFQEEGEEDFRFTGTDFKYGSGSSMGNFSRNTNTHGDYNITDSAGINFQLDKYKGRVLRFKASAMMRVETFGTSNMGFVSVTISLRARKHGAATHKTWDKYDEIVIFDQGAIQTKTFALEVNDVMPEDCDRLEIMVNMTAQHTGAVYIESSFIPAEASGTIVGSSNYIAAQGIQMVSAVSGKRFKLDREAGRATVNELVIESADRQTRGILRIEGNKLKLFKSNGSTLVDDWDV